MDDLEYVRERLRRTAPCKLGTELRGSGVPEATAMKIKYGETKDPGYSTVRRLALHFRAKRASA